MGEPCKTEPEVRGAGTRKGKQKSKMREKGPRLVGGERFRTRGIKEARTGGMHIRGKAPASYGPHLRGNPSAREDLTGFKRAREQVNE